MKINKNIIAAGLALAASNANAAGQCLPCPPGKWSSGGTASSCSQDCPEGKKCSLGAQLDCPNGTWSKSGQSECVPASNFVTLSTQITTATSGNCVYGELSAGVYVVKLVGGNGGKHASGCTGGQTSGGAGATFTYRFIYPGHISPYSSYKKYRLCAGGNGIAGNNSAGGGGAGSWLEIGTGTSTTDFTGQYFFVAGGGGGGSCAGGYGSGGGGGGGGVGAGGMAGSVARGGETQGFGGSVGQYSMSSYYNSIGGVGEGGNGGNGSGGGTAGGAGGGYGGGNGGWGATSDANAGGKGRPADLNSLNDQGQVIKITGQFGGLGADNVQYVGKPGTTARNSNYEGSISGNAVLYKLTY